MKHVRYLAILSLALSTACGGSRADVRPDKTNTTPTSASRYVLLIDTSSSMLRAPDPVDGDEPFPSPYAQLYDGIRQWLSTLPAHDRVEVHYLIGETDDRLSRRPSGVLSPAKAAVALKTAEALGRPAEMDAFDVGLGILDALEKSAFAAGPKKVIVFAALGLVARPKDLTRRRAEIERAVTNGELTLRCIELLAFLDKHGRVCAEPHNRVIEDSSSPTTIAAAIRATIAHRP